MVLPLALQFQPLVLQQHLGGLVVLVHPNKQKHAYQIE